MSLLHKVARFAKSSAGRRAFYEAKRLAQDPRTRRQAKEAFEKIRSRGKGGSASGPQPPAGH